MKKIVAITAAVLALGAAAAPALAQYRWYPIYEYTYYSDAAKTNWVGVRSQHCNNTEDVVGEITGYWTRVQTGQCYTGGGGGEW